MEGNAKVETQDTCNVNERFLVMAAVDCPSLGRIEGEWYKAVQWIFITLTPMTYY